MSTITSLVGTDGITTANSMAKINTNFSNLNTDKMETSVLDTDTTLAANSDSKVATQKAVKAYVDSGGNQNASTSQRGLVEEATQAEVGAGTTSGATGARLFVNPSTLNTRLQFGGTGADGALAITSGTTTVDLGGAQFYVLNYTSISITGTGALAFSNPHASGTTIIIKSQGDVTLTSSATPMINCSGLGADGGAAAVGTSVSGNTGTTGKSFGLFLTNAGLRSTGDSTAAGGAVPTSITSVSTLQYSQSLLSQKYPNTFIGAGGGSGANSSTGSSTSGAGGKGGGCLIIECGGAWNFTTASGISVAGAVGGNASRSGTGDSGGGGGGSGGFCLVIYNTLTANSGTITVSGGAGGTGVGTNKFGGGGAGSATNAGTGFQDNDAGGTGGAGLSLVTSNG